MSGRAARANSPKATAFCFELRSKFPPRTVRADRRPEISTRRWANGGCDTERRGGGGAALVLMSEFSLTDQVRNRRADKQAVQYGSLWRGWVGAPNVQCTVTAKHQGGGFKFSGV